jgi:hypothetical protein
VGITVGGVSAEVVGLGAWCDYVTADEHPGIDPRSLSFRIEQFATLSDGRRLTVASDRGWSSWGSGGMSAEEQWTHTIVEEVVTTVRFVAMPDDEAPWELLAERLHALGIASTPEALEKLPYAVELSSRLRARLTAPGSEA